MDLIFELTSLAQKLDSLGLLKEADLLDRMTNSLLKNAHEEFDVDMFNEFLRGYLEPEEGDPLPLEEAVSRAAEDMENLHLQGESFSVSEDERERAANYVPIQLSSMFDEIAE